ncbi:MAG TPA: cytochrome c oxidase subunit II, partial [Planctomycetaceae bacterium]
IAAGASRTRVLRRHPLIRRGKPQLRRAVAFSAGAVAAFLVGCDGPQSALDPAGRAAEQIADLFWWMAGGATVVWAVVIGLAAYSIHGRPGPHDRQTALMIIGGGVVFPTVVLAVLLSYGLALLPDLVAPAPPGSLTVTVIGEQWWWRVRYETAGGGAVELANEVRLPVGEPVQFRLESADVIHSFWIPPLGGKMDMFPGRTTHLSLLPTRTGTFRGVCAEYCGDSHALMAFPVVVAEGEDFADWLARQAEPAREPVGAAAIRGREVFFSLGCAACHAIRGTPAAGVVGPDLTHVGGRLSLGAGILPNDPDAFARWIGHTDDVKPGVLMPEFGMVPAEDLRALAAYLDELD